MSTTLLYHGFGVRGYHHVRMRNEGGVIHWQIKRSPEKLRCAACQSAHVIRRGGKFRWFQALPVGPKKVRLQLWVHRLECQDCHTLAQEKVDLAPRERVHYTRNLERYALDLCQSMTIQDVANHLGLSWDTVKDMLKLHLDKRYSRPRLKDLKCIGIDEISIGKRHRYLTIVLDLDSGRVVFVGQGKGADALRPFWRRLQASGAKVEAVAMDMSPAYIAAVQEHLPQAAMVFDRFHVVKLYNEKLSDLRCALYREAAGPLEKAVLKGARWLLLTNAENLGHEDPDKDRKMKAHLQEALRLNQPLATAYYMKEDLGQFWEQSDKAKAEVFLDHWIRRAQASGIRMLQQFAKTQRAHRTGLLNYYDYAITTGPVEGINNKIKTLKRQAYGYRDTGFLMLRILGIHETRYVLVG